MSAIRPILDDLAFLELDELREERAALARALAIVDGIVAALESHDSPAHTVTGEAQDFGDMGLDSVLQAAKRYGLTVSTKRTLREGEAMTVRSSPISVDTGPLRLAAENVRNVREDTGSTAGPSAPPPAELGAEGPTSIPEAETVRDEPENTPEPGSTAPGAGPPASDPSEPAGPTLLDHVLAIHEARRGEWLSRSEVLRALPRELQTTLGSVGAAIKTLRDRHQLEHNGERSAAGRCRAPLLPFEAPGDEPQAETHRLAAVKSGRELRLERAEQRRAEHRQRIAAENGEGRPDGSAPAPPREGTLAGRILKTLAWREGTISDVAGRLGIIVDAERRELAMTVAELHDEGSLQLKRRPGLPSIYHVLDLGPAA